jgi:O-methyltransferase involved in polyketide biosynthesis
MDHTAHRASDKPATAARMYDYYLGGVHNFPADREAARVVIEQFPTIPALARANRAFLTRVVRHLVHAGIRQFLDIGSGIPTAGNVHEIAQAVAPKARVVYADIDPVAIAESLQILDGNALATAVRADVREPQSILGHPALRRLLDLGQPIGLLLVGVLHFVPDDEQAYAAVARLVDALAPGSYLAISHGASETFRPFIQRWKNAVDIYQRQTASSAAGRNRTEVARFFTDLDLQDPGVVDLHKWRPNPDEPAQSTDDPPVTGAWAGVARKSRTN